MTDLIKKPKRKSGTKPDYDKPIAYDEWQDRTLVALQKICRQFAVSITSKSSSSTASEKVGFSLALSRHIKDIMTISGKVTSISMSATVQTQQGKLTAKQMRQKLMGATNAKEAKEIIKTLTPRAVDTDEAIDVESKPIPKFEEPIEEPIEKVEAPKSDITYAHYDDASHRISPLTIDKKPLKASKAL